MNNQIYFELSLDFYLRKINAAFSSTHPELISDIEQNAINMVASEFYKISNKYLYEKINNTTLFAIKNAVVNILNDVERQTGVKINLIDNMEY